MMNTIILWLIGFLLLLILVVLLARKKVESNLSIDAILVELRSVAGGLFLQTKLLAKLGREMPDDIVMRNRAEIICAEIQKLAMSNVKDNSKIVERLIAIEVLLAKNLRTLDGRQFEEKKEKRKVAQTGHPWKVEKR